MLLFFRMLDNASSTSGLFLTSKYSVDTETFLRSSIAIGSKRSLLLPHKMRLILLSANSLAVASPIPEEAPVINAVHY